MPAEHLFQKYIHKVAVIRTLEISHDTNSVTVQSHTLGIAVKLDVVWLSGSILKFQE